MYGILRNCSDGIDVEAACFHGARYGGSLSKPRWWVPKFIPSRCLPVGANSERVASGTLADVAQPAKSAVDSARRHHSTNVGMRSREAMWRLQWMRHCALNRASGAAKSRPGWLQCRSVRGAPHECDLPRLGNNGTSQSRPTRQHGKRPEPQPASRARQGQHATEPKKPPRT